MNQSGLVAIEGASVAFLVGQGEGAAERGIEAPALVLENLISRHDITGIAVGTIVVPTVAAKENGGPTEGQREARQGLGETIGQDAIQETASGARGVVEELAIVVIGAWGEVVNIPECQLETSHREFTEIVKLLVVARSIGAVPESHFHVIVFVMYGQMASQDQSIADLNASPEVVVGKLKVEIDIILHGGQSLRPYLGRPNKGHPKEKGHADKHSSGTKYRLTMCLHTKYHLGKTRGNHI